MVATAGPRAATAATPAATPASVAIDVGSAVDVSKAVVPTDGPSSASAKDQHEAHVAAALFPPLYSCPAAANTLKGPETFAWHSQLGEDKALFEKYFKSPMKHQGFFVEMGAVDGSTYSNSFVFEQHMDWRGLLLEVQPANSEALLANAAGRHRSVKLPAGACGWDVGSFAVSNKAGAVGGVLNKMNEAYTSAWKIPTDKGVEVQCAPIGAFLRALGVQSIDLFSLDVEGSEFEVLFCFAV